MLTVNQQAALDIKKNIALTANAGSGKTFVLSKRFLEIALSENVQLRKIAAITFTEKAASELYKKVAAQVEQMAASSTDEKLAEKLKKIRRSLVSANISTIHSFCINLLREYPVEAGLDANFTPIDNITADELTELSADEVIKNALRSDEDSPKIKSLIRIFFSTGIFAKELIGLIGNRKNILELKDKLYNNDSDKIAEVLFEKFYNITSDYLTKKLPQFISDLSDLLSNVKAADPGNKTMLEITPLLTRLQHENDTKTILDILQQLTKLICTQKGDIKSCLIKKLGSVTVEQAGIAEFLSDASFFYYESDHNIVEKQLAETGKDLLYYFEKTLERYNEKKSSKGYLDFEDILLYAKKLLENENVRKSIWQKFDYIMLDEYQDTNEIQYEIFLPILDHLKRGNLFVVGDEKQSIYMFRDAELEVFEKTKKQIEAAGSGRLLVLPDSFRMGPDICLFANHVFKKLFSQPDVFFNEVAHSELVCARPDPPDGEIELLLEEEGGIPEADLVSGKILELKNHKGIKWNQIAILSRKRKSFDELEESFITHKIPYNIIGGRNFYQRQSIYDIFNYFSFLLDNNNDGALAGILRSPFFNLSDSKLYEISLAPGFSFYQKLLAFKDDTLTVVKEKIIEMNALARFKDAPELLRKMLNDSFFTAYLSAKKNGSQETANIRKLIKVTINFYAQGFRTLYDYVNFLKTSINQIEDESQALIADESNTVKIMTIHQAKGLEFPVVFIFKAGETALKTIVIQKKLIVNKDFGILTKVPLDDNYYEDYASAPIVNLNNFIALKKNNAELKRLFYVAVTRAKDFLYITASKKESYSGDSFMGLLSKVFPPDFSSSGCSISGELKYLKEDKETFKLSSHKRSLNIPVRSDIEGNVDIEENTVPESKNFLTEEIKDSVKDEIISATRFSVYNHCPLKYKFTYVDGLLPLINNRSSLSEMEDEKDEDIIAGSAGIKGRIIHKILQEDKEQIDLEYIKGLVRKEEFTISEKAAEKISCEIISDLKKYFESDIYKEIKREEGKNEYEIYIRENDYILFGIIDRLIVKGNTIIVIDYKTDDIPAGKTAERAAEYLNQLKFYSYIIWNAFNSSYKIIFRIIFIKHPDRYFEKEENSSDLKATGQKIREMVENIRRNIFNPERNYCRKCIYSKDHINCIKKEQGII